MFRLTYFSATLLAGGLCLVAASTSTGAVNLKKAAQPATGATPAPAATPAPSPARCREPGGCQIEARARAPDAGFNRPRRPRSSRASRR